MTCLTTIETISKELLNISSSSGSILHSTPLLSTQGCQGFRKVQPKPGNSFFREIAETSRPGGHIMTCCFLPFICRERLIRSENVCQWPLIIEFQHLTLVRRKWLRLGSKMHPNFLLPFSVETTQQNYLRMLFQCLNIQQILSNSYGG